MVGGGWRRDTLRKRWGGVGEVRGKKTEGKKKKWWKEEAGKKKIEGKEKKRGF